MRMHQHGADDAAGRCEAVLPEPSEASNALLAERRLGHKDVDKGIKALRNQCKVSYFHAKHQSIKF